MPLNDGERQVAPTLEGIRRDHVARYEWVAKQLQALDSVVDVGCGIGYGAKVLARKAISVFAIDRDEESILYAQQHYPDDGIRYGWGDVVEASFNSPATIVVAFEIIEHLADPRPMLRSLHKSGCKTLFASVPNEKVFPFKNYKFHHRHYTREEFEALLNECGWRVVEWWGQLGPESDVDRDVEGRTLVVKAAPHVEVYSVPAQPHEVYSVPDSVPAHVAIVALGPSNEVFYRIARSYGGAHAYCDEVWGINQIGDALRCDRVFHMDDVRVQELRAAARPEIDGEVNPIAGMLKWLKTHPGPVYTSVVREGYPGLVAFPLEDVLNKTRDGNGGAPYFNSTVSYAVAYAIHIGVKKISMWGCDFTMADRLHAEKGRACVEFWLGIAAARGIEITINTASPLMDGCAPPAERLYGYDCMHVILYDREDGGVGVRFEPKDPPSAAEIEHRYDHTRHPNRLVEAGQLKVAAE